MFWLLKGSDGRRILVDSGFHRQKFIERWKPRDFRSPADAVRAALGGVAVAAAAVVGPPDVSELAGLAQVRDQRDVSAGRQVGSASGGVAAGASCGV